MLDADSSSNINICSQKLEEMLQVFLASHSNVSSVIILYYVRLALLLARHA